MLEADMARLHNVSVSQVAPDGIWQFPVGAQSQSRQQQARLQRLEGFYSTTFQGHGLSAPRFSLEATLGSKVKLVGNTPTTPRDMIKDFEAYIRYYFEARQQLMRNREPLIYLAFDDYVNALHWIIAPDGMPQVRDSAREPLRPTLSFNFNGVVELTETANELQTDTLPRELSPNSQAGIKRELAPYTEFEDVLTQ